VVTAAERVLVEGGIDALTTNRVAEVAGVSIGTLYQYFPNKNAIVAALFDRYLAIFSEIFVAAVDTSSALDEAARKLGIGVVARFQTQPAIFRMLWRLRGAADVHDRIASHLENMVEPVRGLLVRAGMTDDVRTRVLAFMLVHAGDGIANGVANAAGAIDATTVSMMFVEVIRALSRAVPELRQPAAEKPE
jgi:AcrR family transcriptional regulator